MSLIAGEKYAVVWNAKTKSWYESKSYKFTKIKDNFEVSVEDLTHGSMMKVNYICDYCGVKSQKAYFDLLRCRKKGEKDCCKKCSIIKLKESERRNKIIKGITLSKKFPHLITEWNWNKNINIDPYSLTPVIGLRVWWKCEKEHEWESKISDRTSRNSGCPYCSGHKTPIEKSISNTCKPLLDLWNYNKNTKITPSEVSYGSSLRIWWQCDMGHEWKATACDLYNSLMDGYKGCPYCANKKVNEDNCLATTHPSISAQWNYEKNGTLTPNNVVAGSHKKVFWVCKKNHIWRTAIKSRLSRDCPYCANKIVCEDNCLQTLNPELAAEWHPTKNKLTTYDILPGTNKKVWWLGKCGHEWIATVANRSGINKSGCPECNLSKGEQKVRNFLVKNNYDFKEQVRFKNCRNKHPLPFDFAVFDNNKLECLIEYDGMQHDYEFEYFGGAKGFQDRKQNDQIKDDYCSQFEIPLIRLSYKVFTRLESELEKKLLKVK